MKEKSLLFIPAKEKTLNKVGLLNADAYIIDLEDSIEEDNKEKALLDVKSFLDNYKQDSFNIYVRLNKNRYSYEAELLDHYDNIGFMLPKFENVDEYVDCFDIWNRHPVIALIETPKSIVNIMNISQCEWIYGLAFGAEDYTASVNMEKSNQRLFFQKSTIVTYGKAFGKKVYDTPCFEIKDKNAITEEVKDTVAYGFDGKLAIHPKQVEIINQLFNSVDLEHIKYIVETYENNGNAVVVIDGYPYEKMHIARFKRIIRENGGD